VGAVVALCLVLLPPLYALSCGPVAWAYNHRVVSVDRETLTTLYTPLIWLHRHTALKGPLRWYTRLFVDTLPFGMVLFPEDFPGALMV
jgi:hypothetical protein